jgi:hypothetical protein
VVESVIKAGVMWVLSLLNPASAFVRACKAIYDIIMFFIERGSQIAELVSAVTDSVAAIANGAVGGAAKLIENALGTALPVVISFMASLLGLGGISEKIEGVIKTVRQPIDKAIDWLIAQAVKFAKKIGGKLGFGKDKKGKDNKEDKSESEKKHADMGNAAAKELSQKPDKEIPYEELRPAKEQKAKELEANYNKQLENPVKMTISFQSPEKDKKDGDMDFTVKIAPNDTVINGQIPLDTDEGTEENPFSLKWPKPYSEQYKPLYLGGKTDQVKSQADLEKAKGKKDETGQEIKAYHPHNQSVLPGGEVIGLSEKFKVFPGKIIGPLSGKSSPGGGKLNRVLAKYGFSPTNEGLDADHVVEIQLGGSDALPNLWPLDSSINRSSGSTIHSTTVLGPKSGSAKKISELKEDKSRKYYFKIE